MQRASIGGAHRQVASRSRQFREPPDAQRELATGSASVGGTRPGRSRPRLERRTESPQPGGCAASRGRSPAPQGAAAWQGGPSASLQTPDLLGQDCCGGQLRPKLRPCPAGGAEGGAPDRRSCWSALRKRGDSNPRSLAGRSLSRRVHSAALPRFHAAGYADDSVPVERVRSCYARPARSVVDSWCTSESSARGTRPRHTR